MGMDIIQSTQNKSSVTDWLDSVKQGDDAAAQKIWARYVEQLVHAANGLLRHSPRRVVDGEDVAQEAFSHFFRGVAEGRFPQLDDRNDLWQILIVLASRRAADFQRRELADRRGGGEVRGDSGIRLVQTECLTGDVFDSIEALPVTPETAEDLLKLIALSFPEIIRYNLQHVALDRVSNYTISEIAIRQRISVRGVERKLSLIRSVIQQAAQRTE